MKKVNEEDLLKQTDNKGCRITFKDSGKPLLQNKVAVNTDKMIKDTTLFSMGKKKVQQIIRKN